MTRRRFPLLCLLVWLPVAANLAIAPPAASAAPDWVEVPARGLRYQGLTPGRPDGPCKGKFEMRAAAGRGGPPRCTHGPDPAPEGVDVRVARQPETPSETAALRPETVARGAALCSGDGVSGPRVQLVYANFTGKPDRYAAFASSFQVWAAATDTVFDTSARETGGSRRIKFVHDAACAPVVHRITLSAAAGGDFETMVDELWARGLNRNDRKYLVWADANVYCGIGEVINDDRAGQNNYNNVHGMFSRVDAGCWGLAGQSVEAHELMHNLGGVQESAPHATAFNHCTDDRDRMCYADGSGEPVTQVCPPAHENVFDCNHDDYFHTAPAAGSYLATHWNVANSAWLVALPLATVPQAPVVLSAVAGEGLVTLHWLPPTGDGGMPVTGYVVTPFDGAVPQTARTFASTATTQTVSGLVDGRTYTFRVAAVNGVGTGLQSQPSVPVTPTAGSRFNPLTPARLLDTRFGNGAPAAKVLPGGRVDLQVSGRGGVPSTGVSAVVLNLTVTEPVSQGYVTAWPTGEERPTVSNLNFVPDQTVPNLAVVKVGDGGMVSLYNGAPGALHLVADVAGWYGASGADAGSRYHALAPARLLDTRTGVGGLLQKLVAGGWLDLQVTGRGGVPATGVSAVVLNVTVTEPLAGGFLTGWPTGEMLPLASNLNFAGGQTVPNLVVAKVGDGGKVSLYNGGGSTHVVADVAGWFGPDGEDQGARYHEVTPRRLLDTRFGLGGPQARVPAGGTVHLQVTDNDDVPAAGVGSVALNVTVVDAAAGGYLTAWPTGTTRPLASNLNFAPGQTVPNMVVAKLGVGGKVSFYNGSAGPVDLIADVGGWYGTG